jgi:hypothetical protein
MLRECVECNATFDTNSPAKIRAGGRVNTCPDCSEEPAVKYLGLANGDGKQASVTVLAFDTPKDRERYASYWKANTGYYKGKSCHLSQSNPADPGVKFRTVVQSSAANHKGKL